MTDEAGRAQDQARRHRRRGQPSAETATLLAEYQAAMRDELRAVLAELRGRLPDTSLVPPAAGERIEPARPSLKDRAALWDLGMKLGRELGTEIDPAGVGPSDEPAAAPRRARRGRVDFG